MCPNRHLSLSLLWSDMSDQGAIQGRGSLVDCFLCPWFFLGELTDRWLSLRKSSLLNSWNFSLVAKTLRQNFRSQSCWRLGVKSEFRLLCCSWNIPSLFFRHWGCYLEPQPQQIDIGVLGSNFHIWISVDSYDSAGPLDSESLARVPSLYIHGFENPHPEELSRISLHLSLLLPQPAKPEALKAILQRFQVQPVAQDYGTEPV